MITLNRTRKFFTLILCLLFALSFSTGFVFAEDTAEATISEADVKAFIKNYDGISKAIEDADNKVDENTPDDVTIAVYQELEAKLGKYGITGEGKIGKCSFIQMGYGIIASEKAMNTNRLTKSYMKENYESGLSDADRKILEAYYVELSKVFGAEVIDDDVGEVKSFKEELKDEVKKEVKNEIKEDVKRKSRDAVKGALRNLF